MISGSLWHDENGGALLGQRMVDLFHGIPGAFFIFAVNQDVTAKPVEKSEKGNPEDLFFAQGNGAGWNHARHGE